MVGKAVLGVAVIAWLAATPAWSAALPKGTVVRVQASGIEPGWHEGKIGVTPAGCTMVHLDRKARGGYTMVSMKGASQLQRKDAAGWTDVPVKTLASQEPKACQGDND
jgi:hypothetical protein